MIFHRVFPSNVLLTESGCKIGYEPTKMSRDHFWRSISSDTNMEVSALSTPVNSNLPPPFDAPLVAKKPGNISSRCCWIQISVWLPQGSNLRRNKELTFTFNLCIIFACSFFCAFLSFYGQIDRVSCFRPQMELLNTLLSGKSFVNLLETICCYIRLLCHCSVFSHLFMID